MNPLNLSNPPLTGIKVLELATVLAGPAVGMFFAELGAEVIKIEPPNGDVTRTWRIKEEDSFTDPTAYFSAVNWGKNSKFWNITQPEILEQVYRLVKNSDILICNFKPGDAEKLKMNFETLSQINPSLIYGQITGYGDENPRVGYDAIVQAESGFMYLNREPDQLPNKIPVAIMDLLAAHQLKEGILTALYQRTQTGKGCKVEVSLFDSGISSLANQASSWLMRKVNPLPIGSDHPSIVPYGTVFETIDHKHIILAVGNDKQFEGLCAILNCPEMSKNEMYATNPQRVKNRQNLKLILAEKIKFFTSTHILQQLHYASIPAGAIHSVAEAFDTKEAKQLLLFDENNEAKGVRTAVFKLNHQFPISNLSSPQPKQSI